MARPSLSDDEVASFRQRIAEVATHLFVQRGFEAVTMRAVADALSVSAMALYRYVADKEDLLVLVRTHAYRSFGNSQERAFRSGAEAHRVSALGEAYIAFALERPDAYRIMFELHQPHAAHAELQRESERSFSYLLRAWEERVEAGLEQGDPQTLAHLSWATVHGIVSLHLAGKLNLGRDLRALSAALGASRAKAAVVKKAGKSKTKSPVKRSKS